MRPASWLWRAVGWDGVVPVAVASVPLLVRAVCRDPGIVAFTVVFVPICAAMLRANIGRWQIVRVCGEPPPISRQLGLSAAIVLLLLFELSMGILACSIGEPHAVWCVPATIFAFYLIVITFTLRPVAEGQVDIPAVAEPTPGFGAPLDGRGRG
jgi:hypothetical protein